MDSSIKCNRAINNQILDTRNHEYITFSPTAIMGFPGNPDFGDELVFQITGGLTTRDTTNQVTFDVWVIAESENLIKG